MKYEELPSLSRSELETLLASDNPDDIAVGLLSASQLDGNVEWVIAKCLDGLDHSALVVKAAAITALSHIARIHRSPTLTTILPRLEMLRDDPDVGGRAEDTIEDIQLFASTS